MRELKFRQWNEELKQWVYFNLFDMLHFIYDIQQHHQVHDYNSTNIRKLTFSRKLFQYTGLKDKNGKEIYEGDILKSPRDTIVVEYDTFSNCGWCCDTVAGIGFNIEYEDPEQYCEIIGNIVETPELIPE